MPMSNYAKLQMLDALPGTVYVAFFSGGAPGVGSEVSPATLWGSGARPAVTMDAAASNARGPDGDAALGTADAASTTVTHVAYYDADTAGNLLSHGAYARTILAGDVIDIPDAANIFSLSDAA